jgi:hypothetical protein
MAKLAAHPLERVLVEMTAMLRVLADRQTILERAMLHLARGEALPADMAERLNETVKNAEASRDLMLRGVSPSAMLTKTSGRG